MHFIGWKKLYNIVRLYKDQEANWDSDKGFLGWLSRGVVKTCDGRAIGPGDAFGSALIESEVSIWRKATAENEEDEIRSVELSGFGGNFCVLLAILNLDTKLSFVRLWSAYIKTSRVILAAVRSGS